MCMYYTPFHLQSATLGNLIRGNYSSERLRLALSVYIHASVCCATHLIYLAWLGIKCIYWIWTHSLWLRVVFRVLRMSSPTGWAFILEGYGYEVV